MMNTFWGFLTIVVIIAIVGMLGLMVSQQSITAQQLSDAQTEIAISKATIQQLGEKLVVAEQKTADAEKKVADLQAENDALRKKSSQPTGASYNVRTPAVTEQAVVPGLDNYKQVIPAGAGMLLLSTVGGYTLLRRKTSPQRRYTVTMTREQLDEYIYWQRHSRDQKPA